MSRECQGSCPGAPGLGCNPGSHQIQSVKMCRVHPATVPLEPVYSKRCHITQVWDSRGFWSPAYPYPMLNPLRFGMEACGGCLLGDQRAIEVLSRRPRTFWGTGPFLRNYEKSPERYMYVGPLGLTCPSSAPEELLLGSGSMVLPESSSVLPAPWPASPTPECYVPAGC